MKVVVDDKIPYIRESLEKAISHVVYLPGDKITNQDIIYADALIVRTRTRCDEKLLKKSQVRFIATATIGYDHIDTKYCDENGIIWKNAPGSNASSVAQYVRSALLLLQREKNVDLSNLTMGIVGVGNVGTKIHAVARQFGMKVLLNDPPRRDNGDDLPFVGLDTIAREADIITFHTPLIKTGKYETFHLADNSFFSSLERKPVIINTSRGEVIDTEALLHAIRDKKVKELILDVWEGEPNINRSLLAETFLGTPHIAGYSADGKANASRMALEELFRFFEIYSPISVSPPLPENKLLKNLTPDEASLFIYNPKVDNDFLKANPELFEYYRENYPLRREDSAYLMS